MHIMFENSEELENRKGYILSRQYKEDKFSNFNDTKRCSKFGYHKIQKKNLTNSKSLFKSLILKIFTFPFV